MGVRIQRNVWRSFRRNTLPRKITKKVVVANGANVVEADGAVEAVAVAVVAVGIPRNKETVIHPVSKLQKLIKFNLLYF